MDLKMFLFPINLFSKQDNSTRINLCTYSLVFISVCLKILIKHFYLIVCISLEIIEKIEITEQLEMPTVILKI